jgi:hypothetical protein
MDQSEKKLFPADLGFFMRCKRAISNQEYRNALEILTEGLDDLLENDEQIGNASLIMHFQAIVDELESTLKNTYGDAWGLQAQDAGRPRESRKIACSFCKKTQTQVAKIIAGPDVYICDECVEICGQIISESTEDPDR